MKISLISNTIRVIRVWQNCTYTTSAPTKCTKTEWATYLEFFVLPHDILVASATQTNLRNLPVIEHVKFLACIVNEYNITANEIDCS